MVAQTPTWGIRYPDDYQSPADSPNALQQLALDVDGMGVALNTAGYSGFNRVTDIPLTANVDTYMVWETTFAVPSYAMPTVTHDTTTQPGRSLLWPRYTALHQIEVAFAVRHPTVNTARTFEILVNHMGVQEDRAPFLVQQGAVSRAVQFGVIRTVPLQATVAAIAVALKPIGTAATGWTLSYARCVITKVR